MKKANNGFKYKADKDFYEAALKDNPGAVFNHYFKKEIETNSKRYFDFLDFTGNDKDLSRYAVMLNCIERNRSYNKVLVKTTDISLIQYPVSYMFIDKTHLSLYEAKQGLTDGVTYYMGRNPVNPEMFTLCSMVHGEKYMYEAKGNNFQKMNEYILIPNRKEATMNMEQANENDYNTLVFDSKIVELNNQMVITTIKEVDNEMKRQLALKLKEYNVGTLKDEHAFIEKICSMLDEESYRNKLINNERLKDIREDILEYDRFNLEYKGNIVFMQNDIDYVPVKIIRDGQNEERKTVFSVLGINVRYPEKFAVWKKCNLTTDLDQGKFDLTKDEAKMLFDGDNRKIISDLIKNLIEKSGIDKKEIMDYINESKIDVDSKNTKSNDEINIEI